MSEVKPVACPWCGATDGETVADENQGTKWGACRCSCGVVGPEVRTGYDLSESAPWRAEAIAAWNAQEHHNRVVAELRAENETLQLQLAACGVAAMCNTKEARDLHFRDIGPGHPSYSASLGDVLRAVDREMSERARVAEMEADARRVRSVVTDHLADLERCVPILREHGLNTVADECEKAVSELRAAIGQQLAKGGEG